MKLKSAIIACAAVVIAACAPKSDYVRFVDTHIGSGGHGHVFVGASVPFGMVQVGPVSVPRDWDWCSGYHVSDSTVIGFALTHINGTGVGDLCDINVLPVVGTDIDYTREGIADKADRDKEISTPDYYSVPLENSGVLCEMTATDHTGYFKFSFPKGAADKAIIFNLQDGGNTDSNNVTSEFTVVDPTHVTGFRNSHGWAVDQKVWFAAEFSAPIVSESNPAGNYYRLDFDADDIDFKVTISPESADNALKIVKAELPTWYFGLVRGNARNAWNNELSRAAVETGDESLKTIFYTAFYHTMIDPAHFSDNGKKVRYTVLSLWDTYRAWAPLFTILHSGKENDFINTFLDIYDAQGKLPIWHLWGNETNCMVGTPAIPIVSDAILKGFDGFDLDKAYNAMKSSAMNPERGQSYRLEGRHIPSDGFKGSVAYELEYCISDWAMAQAALKLGHQDDYVYFLERSKGYKKHFDPETGFMRGINENGKWSEPFSPFYSNHSNSDYIEGNGWHYTWLVPHDFDGLCECFGSKDALIQKLDSLFVVSSKIEGENASMDISGLIGQYCHGNEPSHHTVYLYSLAGLPWKAADMVRKIMSELYSTEPDGICGNEDCGQMSAWYMLSAFGFYQVEPAGGRYFFGTPLFDKVTLKLENGKTFSIVAHGNSDANRYIQSITLNGQPYNKAWIDYADIMAGGELVYEMGQEKVLWY